ncbi:MAG: preprotein translocase subunit SecA [Alphaproteobacteria bacterium]|nr:preprotein translocase subunit SecA [Alphaproteobacteria bacterium]
MLFHRLFGSANDRYIKSLHKIVKQINEQEAEVENLSDEQLKARTPWLKERYQNGESLDDLLVDAFATVREAAKRTLKQRPFDVQLLGGIVLHKGQVAEMKTGEGKTLVATLPVYLNALAGKGVHVVTVNDYLAKRDSEWMGQIYRFLGLSVGCILHEQEGDDRKKQYDADITYGTNNEFGFDYLRDNMRFSLEERVQRPFFFALIDEVDSILIDEARTPLIISGQAEDSSEKYIVVDKLVKKLTPEHFEKDEKNRSVVLTEAGNEYIESLLQEVGLIEENSSLYDIQNAAFVHHVEEALQAHQLFQKDVNYIVKENQVVIIDEFTGRMMAGRRYSDGLHQAIEAKEGVEIQPENQTLASITFQNYFRLYPTLSGMTGTAMTEAGELDSIYKLDVIEIPTNLPCQRKDYHDEIYRTLDEKYDAIIKEIEKVHKKGQPILVGTTSIEKSELLAELLRQRTDLRFEVLNARHHEREAHIVAQAGVPGAITIATNMAGRGTDIQLGGNLKMRLEVELEGKTDPKEIEQITQKVQEEIAKGKEDALNAGGLYVLGTERHESRRIDNQLRGRSGRQGDPGASKFYVSLGDDLMRIFGSDRISQILKTLGMPKGEAIIHPWINKAIQKAQQKIEAYHFDIRKNLLKYDDVINDQRKVIYTERNEVMEANKIEEKINEMISESIENMCLSFMPPKSTLVDWDMSAFRIECIRLINIDAPLEEWAAEENITSEKVYNRLLKGVFESLHKKDELYGIEALRSIKKTLLLQMIDGAWKEHLQVVDFVRHSIGLRAFGQRDPLNEYKKEAFLSFANMLDNIRERITILMTHMDIQPAAESSVQEEIPLTTNKEDESVHEFIEKKKKVGRNDPCPCGSGKKYKHCCGALK